MKKIFLIFIPLLFISCTETNNSEKIIGSSEEIKKYINTEEIEIYSITKNRTNQTVLISRDTNTDVLYYTSMITINAVGYGFVTPIMEADGTCLTYTKWKNKQ